MLVGVWDRCGFQGHIGFVGCSRGWEFEICIWGIGVRNLMCIVPTYPVLGTLESE